MSNETQSNRRGWDGLAETHYQRYDIDRLVGGTPLINDIIRREVGDVNGRSLLHLLCHIGTDTLSWALLGAKVTGVDISPEALKFARTLADRMGIDAEFIESDVMQVIDKVHTKHDIVFSSIGVLCWLPDINRYAQTVRHLLKDDGVFYLFDGHPFRSVFLDEDGEFQFGKVIHDYFGRRMWEYPNMGDYTDPDLKVPEESYEWDHTMGDIVTALCDAGLRIEFLHEFPQFYYGGYTPPPEEETGPELYPVAFSIRARG